MIQFNDIFSLIILSFVLCLNLYSQIETQSLTHVPNISSGDWSTFRKHPTGRNYPLLQLDFKEIEREIAHLKEELKHIYPSEEQTQEKKDGTCIPFQSKFDATWLQEFCADSKVFVHGGYECFANDLIHPDLALSLQNQMFPHCASHCVYHWADPTRQGWFYISRGQCFKEIEDPLHQCFVRWKNDKLKMAARSEDFCRTDEYKNLVHKQRTGMLEDYLTLDKGSLTSRLQNLKDRLEDKESQRLFVQETDDPSKTKEEIAELISKIKQEYKDFMKNEENKNILENYPRRAVTVFSPTTRRVTWYSNEATKLLYSSWKLVVELGEHVEESRGEKFVPLDLIIFRPYAIHRGLPTACVVSTKEDVLREHKTSKSRCVILELDGLERNIWIGYNGYINSIRFLHVEKYRNLFYHYNQILKTDTDTFITPAFVHWRPNKLISGKGAYIHFKSTKQKVKDVGKYKGIDHYDMHNVGATWYGPPLPQMIASVISTELAHYILYNEFKREEKSQGNWPGWYRGVTSMYSSELGINHATSGKHRILAGVLDCKSEMKRSVEHCGHIHCWHSDASLIFSKFAFKDGKYTQESFPREKIKAMDLLDVRYYALAVSLNYTDLIFEKAKHLDFKQIAKRFENMIKD